MKKYLYILIGLAIVLAGLGMSLNSSSAQTSTINLKGWAWSSTIGWLSLSSTNDGAGVGASYGVTISTSTNAGGDVIGSLSGYAWSSNIGWISFNRSVTGNPPSDDIGGGSGAIAQVNITTGAMTGWGRALSGISNSSWDGWIHLSGTNHPTLTTLAGTDVSTAGVSFNTVSKKISGFSWGNEVVGWLNWMTDGSGGGGGVPCDPPGSCDDNDNDPTISVTCNAPGPLTLPSGGGTVDGTFSLTITGGSGTRTYDWTGGGGTQVGADNLSTFVKQYSTAGTYDGPTVDVSDSTGSDSDLCSDVVVNNYTNPPGGTCPQPEPLNASLCPNSATDGPGRILRNRRDPPLPSLCQSTALTPLQCEYQCSEGYTLSSGECVIVDIDET